MPSALVAAAVFALLSACATPAPQVTEEEVRREYERVVARVFSGKEYAVRHILVEKREQAVAGLQRIRSGESFAKVALDLSADPSSNQIGGDLGWSLPDHFVPEFSRAMVSLGPSGMSAEPVQTQFGWHIIDVTGLRTQQPPPFEQLKDMIAERLRQEKAK
jgi:peptidyl-prolyl cis-trans isomerase C